MISTEGNRNTISHVSDTANIELAPCDRDLFLSDYVTSTIEPVNPNDPSAGPTVIHFMGDEHELTMKVNLRDGKQDGKALIVRNDGTPFIRLVYVNGIPEGEVEKMDEHGTVIMRGQLRNGRPFGLFTEFDGNGKVTWTGTYKKEWVLRGDC